MSSDALAVSVQSVSKTYRIATAVEQRPTLTELLVERARHPLARQAREDFQALTDVSLEVQSGEAVGIIGRNGAGKSTLLKILSRIVAPTSGRIELYGRLGSLLEVGTGFHPELTGRENIYLNGAILGMKRREISTEFDSIVEFAGVKRFLDTPVKRYSSGMYVRLAFAVAAHLNPEILVVDEVLAVGDAAFQKKCLGKMDEVSTQGGRTVIFVSHNMPAVQSFCRRCIYLEEGQIAFDGETDEAIDRYLSSGSAGIERATGVFDLTHAPRGSAVSEPILRGVEVRRLDGTVAGTIPMGGGMCVAIDVASLSVSAHRVIARILTETGMPVATIVTEMKPLEIFREDLEPEQVVLRIPQLPLVAGQYWIELLVKESSQGKYATLDHIERAAEFEVTPADVFGSGYRVGKRFLQTGVIFLDASWQVQADGVVIAASSPGR